MKICNGFQFCWNLNTILLRYCVENFIVKTIKFWLYDLGNVFDFSSHYPIIWDG